MPAGKDWVHEIKHDGYRLIVQRDGQRVRLFTRYGHDCNGLDAHAARAMPRHWCLRLFWMGRRMH